MCVTMFNRPTSYSHASYSHVKANPMIYIFVVAFSLADYRVKALEVCCCKKMSVIYVFGVEPSYPTFTPTRFSTLYRFVQRTSIYGSAFK